MRLNAEEFGEWLRGVCAEIKVQGEKELHALIIRAIDDLDHPGEKTVGRWWRGENAPRESQLEVLLPALRTKVPDIMERFDEFFMDQARKNSRDIRERALTRAKRVQPQMSYYISIPDTLAA